MDTTPGPGGWPLSAAATALLRNPAAQPHLLLRLALRELVVRGAVRAHPVEQRRWRQAKVRLSPGAVDAAVLPAPLPLLAAALAPHLDEQGTSAADAVLKASGWRADLAVRVRDAARDELRTAGLLAARRGRRFGVIPRTRYELTPSGRAWARSASDPAALPADALPAAGLLLVLDEELQRRLRDSAVHVPAEWGDADALDAVLSGAGPALDAAADGSSGGGDGGDGGGGGGGGD